MSEINLTISDIDFLELYGENNAYLNIIRTASPNISITARGNNLKLVGEKKETQKLKAKFEIMVRMLKEKHELTGQIVEDHNSRTTLKRQGSSTHKSRCSALQCEHCIRNHIGTCDQGDSVATVL